MTSGGGVVGPFTLQLEDSTGSFARTLGRQQPDSAVTSDGQRLSVGPWTLDATHATPWSSQVDWPCLNDPPAAWLSILDYVKGQALLSSSSRWECTMEEHLHLRVDGFRAALKGSDQEQIKRACLALVGFGPGLTPAGDDYLAGSLLALRTVNPSLRDAITLAVMAGLRGRTSHISWALLQAASRGEASEPWHRLAAALRSADPDEARRAAEGVTHIGHSTGSWSLQGFLQTLTVINDTEGAAIRPPPPQRGS